jgi:hypothetical protein
MSSTNHNKALDKVKHLKKQKNYLMFSPLAQQKFSEECELIYQSILTEIERIAKRCITQNTKTDKYFVFCINSCGFVDLSIIDSDCLTHVEKDAMDWNLATKRHKYYNYEGYFNGYSLMLFERALDEIVTINQKIDKWK